MKKVLMGTSAIALATAAATPAMAADWDVKVGGYAFGKTAYVSVDIDNPAAGAAGTFDLDGVDMKFDGEIFFLPSIELDNGIKVGANIQLEARSGSGGTPDTIDEAYIYIDGDFGRFDLGDENSAGYKMTYAGPDVSLSGTNSPSSTIFVPYSGSVGAGVLHGQDLFRGTLASTFIENERNNDATRFTYYTKRFAGFQLGVSYARDGAQNSQTQLDLDGAALRDIIDVGANYVQSFGDLEVAVSGRWGIATDDRAAVPNTDIGEDPEIFGGGAQITYGPVTIGGGFAEQNHAGTEDGQSYHAGIKFTSGPWALSVAWFHGENVDEEAVTGGADSTIPVSAAAAANGIDEQVDNYALGVTYQLGKGVKLGGFAGFTQFDEDVGDGGVANGGNDIEGFFIGGGINLNF